MENTLCRVLCLGDVVGRAGRRLLAERLPELRVALDVDMVIANGENASGGIGLTPEGLRELLSARVDVVTTGNHIWKHKEIHPSLDRNNALLRPANYGPKAPGRGFRLCVLPCGTRVGVLNLIGRSFMEPLHCPFQAADAALAVLAEEGAAFCLVDFHAEASSEKRAMAHYLDGRAAAVLGTHTHVQTADNRVLPGGTAYITDLGMTGPLNGILGVRKNIILETMVTKLPKRYEIELERPWQFNGVLIDIDDETNKAVRIDRIYRIYE